MLKAHRQYRIYHIPEKFKIGECINCIEACKSKPVYTMKGNLDGKTALYIFVRHVIQAYHSL